MKLRTLLAVGFASLLTAVLAAQAQVPGVNSTLQSVFTLAYDNSTMKQTFSAASPGFTIPATAQDICTLTGSATKNIRIRRIIISAKNADLQSDPVAIIKRSTNTTGGVSVLTTKVPYDSANAAATAVAEYYTTSSGSTAGTLVGVLADILVPFGNLTTGLVVPTTFEFGKLGQPIVLRGAAQQVAVNLSNLTYTTGTMTCTFEWTEE